MVKNLIIKFYCTERSCRKMKNIVKDMSIHIIPVSLDLPFEAHFNASCSEQDAVHFNYIWEMVRLRKDTAFYSNEQLLTKQQAEDIFNWIRCYLNRKHFHNQTDYCCISPGIKELHGWGCKWLHSVLRHGRFGRHKGIDWWKVGPFDGKVQFIDKEAIKEMFRDEADKKNLELCPFFFLEKAFQYVDMLPEQINPTIDEEWSYNITTTSGNLLSATGVTPTPYNSFSDPPNIFD